MTSRSHLQDHEGRFERELARDRALLRFMENATLLGSLTIVVILLVLVLALSRTSVWLSVLPLYSATTRLLVFVARYALRLPFFLLELDSTDPAVATAAHAVFEGNREAMAGALLITGNQRPSAQQIRALTPAEAAAIARERDLPGRRRTGIVCAALWCVVSIAIWGAVIATRGGPTN